MAKRAFDIAFSLMALILGAPLFILCAFAIKTSSKGPILYKQPRVGKDRKIFSCLKFRTMCIDAEIKLQALLSANPALFEEWKIYHKLKFDPRITQVGKFLRKTSLDELPQFLNILKGEMSVVGPRPKTEDEIANQLKEIAEKILSIRPGLTSLWINKGRCLLSFQERAELDVRYVETQSFWLDLFLIGQTVIAMIFPKGAY